MTPSLAIWTAATLAHVLLTVRAVRRLVSADDTLDKVIFATAVSTVGSLAIVLHFAALTVGLSLWSGTALLSLWHVAVYIATRRGEPIATRPQGVLEWLALQPRSSGAADSRFVIYCQWPRYCRSSGM